MHNIKKVTDDLFWVGVNDRRLAMFEGVYSVPKGVSYNSYLLLDEKTVLFDTVDKAVHYQFIENLTFALKGKKVDYLVIHHMEPDHSAGICDLLDLYPELTIVCNGKSKKMIEQFNEVDINSRVKIVAEGDILNTGKHNLQFFMAPMVHWPEVMVTYDTTDKILFSADAFGCFGALNGAIFADEVDFSRDYMDEARRYYTNIVGKYGPQVKSLLGKVANDQIEMICPLHGFVWRKNFQSILSKYQLWSNYEPEEKGVMIAYASVYGNTENAAEILSSNLRDRGVKTVMFDVSVTPASEIIAAAFQYSHLVFASTTYNAGIFVTMEALINDLVAHNIQNRTVAIIENGSWAATSGGLIQEKLSKCKNMNILVPLLTISSSVKPSQLEEISAIANQLAETLPKTMMIGSCLEHPSGKKEMDLNTLFKLSYGLYVLSTRVEGKDNGCITNTVIQATHNPPRVTVIVNKTNLTHDMMVSSRAFNVSILTESTPFSTFEKFGFHSGRDTDKFSKGDDIKRTCNGIPYLTESTNGIISGEVIEVVDVGTHSLFVADITEAFTLSKEPSVTYQYYFDHIKPKPEPPKEVKKGYVCKICGYIYEGDELPSDFICPICKHSGSDFEKIK